MPVASTVLFDQPQREIASLIAQRFAQCSTASLVAGFATVAGLDRIARPLVAARHKLGHLVVGAGTYSAYEAFDALIGEGVSRDRLMVNLGMSRLRGAGKFERFRPMLHSKVYLFDMGSNQAAAFVGSHNLTAFALGGLNGEAGILLEGDSSDPAFDQLRSHIGACVAGAVQYDTTMKDAYAWWASEYFNGLRIEVEDAPRDTSGGRTVVIFAELVEGPPRQGDIVYFEAPAALNEARSLGGDVHLYLFDRLPGSPEQALSQRDSARYKLGCKTVGVEEGRGAVEVNADWHIDDRRSPKLETVKKPFRPRTQASMHQVRAQVGRPLPESIAYQFDSGRKAWAPVLEQQKLHRVIDDEGDFLKMDRRRRTETGVWYPVRELIPAEAVDKKELALALRESAPGSGSYVLVAQRRRTV
jgi:hypothetical protein